MSTPKNTPLAPLIHLQNINKRFPNIWQYTDDALAFRDEGNATWNDLCYLPIAFGTSTLIGAYNLPEDVATGLASDVVCLASWRQDKTIYKFEEALCAELIEQADDTKIPIEIFNYMPAKCIYIQYPENPNLDGFFCWIEHDTRPEHNRLELRLLYLDHNGDIVLQNIVHLIPNKTISDGIDASIRLIQRNLNSSNDPQILNLKAFQIGEIINQQKQNICEAVQLVLYVCAENADILENEQQSKIYHFNTKNIRDKFREIRLYNVGIKVSRLLRAKDKLQQHNAQQSKSSKKSPHIRKAHWHHYWVGEGRSQLTLKWLNPMIINENDYFNTTE